MRARHHGHERILCPHVLGWHNGRAKALCHQADGTTSHGPLPSEPTQRWRTLFIDEIEDPTILDGPWQTADNYTHHPLGIDVIHVAIDPSALSKRY